MFSAWPRFNDSRQVPGPEEYRAAHGRESCTAQSSPGLEESRTAQLSP